MTKGPEVMSVIVILGFFGMAFVIFGVPVMTGSPLALGADASRLADGIMGAVTAQFVGVVQYWVGSSNGSRMKDIRS